MGLAAKTTRYSALSGQNPNPMLLVTSVSRSRVLNAHRICPGSGGTSIPAASAWVTNCTTDRTVTDLPAAHVVAIGETRNRHPCVRASNSRLAIF